MAREVQIQLFNSFMGTMEGVHSAILPDVFSPEGSKNVWMDKYARVRKILGYTGLNASPIITNTASSVTKVVGLRAYRGTAGGSLTRQLVAAVDDETNEWELWTSTNNGSTWTFGVDLGAGSVGAIPDFVQYEDNLFVVNGVMSPRQWNGTAWSTAGGVQSPKVTSAAASTATGNLNGNYTWKLVSVEADGSRHPGSLVSTTLALEDQDADLTWTLDSDTNVTGYELYRTTGTGGWFYFVDYIDLRATAAYTDDTTDDTILGERSLQEHGDAPPAVYLCEGHKQRVWWGRTDTYPRRVYPSDPGNPDSTWHDTNYLDLDDEERSGGDVLTGLRSHRGVLNAFLEHSIFVISGTGQVAGDIVDWTVRRSNAQVGAVSQRSIVRVPAGAKLIDQQGRVVSTDLSALAYFTPAGDIRLFDGENDTIISHPLRDTIATLNYSQRTKVHAIVDPVRTQVTWYFPSGTSTECDKAAVWNWRFGVWSIIDPANFASSAYVDTAAGRQLLAGEARVGTGGYVYSTWSGNDFGGSEIEATWLTKGVTGMLEDGTPMLAYTKRWRWVDLIIKNIPSTGIVMNWFETYADSTAAPDGTQTITHSSAILSGDGSAILSVASSALSSGSSSLQTRKQLHTAAVDYPHSEALFIQFTESSKLEPWSIEAFSLGFQVLEGIRTR